MEKQAWIVEKRDIENGVVIFTSLEVYLDEKKAWDRCEELSKTIKFVDGYSDIFYGLCGPLTIKE